MMRRAPCVAPTAGAALAQRRWLSGSGMGVGMTYGGAKLLHMRTRLSNNTNISTMVKGPKAAMRVKANPYGFWRWARSMHFRGMPHEFEMYMERARPERDLPWGEKYVSRASKNPDEYFPEVGNPYDDGRNLMMSGSAELADLLPFLLHHIDDRLATTGIVHGVLAVQAHAPTVDAFVERSAEWGWLERMEAISSRVVVHHMKLLTQLVQTQQAMRKHRAEFAEKWGILRTNNGDRYYVLPGQKETYTYRRWSDHEHVN